MVQSMLHSSQALVHVHCITCCTCGNTYVPYVPRVCLQAQLKAATDDVNKASTVLSEAKQAVWTIKHVLEANGYRNVIAIARARVPVVKVCTVCGVCTV
jgi:hypothetical protein